MNRKFGGFTPEQMEAIARQSLDYQGPMEGLNDFLAASPDKAAKLSRLTEKARSRIEDVQDMASGGSVKKKTKTKTQTTTATDALKNSQAGQFTTQAITNPNKLITPATATPIKVQSGQFVDENAGDLGAAPTGTATTVPTASEATTAPQTAANTYEATQVAPQVNEAVEGTTAAQGTVSQNSQVEAATALPSADATVQGQLEKLMSGFDENNIPPWAAGAKRAADAIMGQRGLGASSMAASASTQTLMESALSIAVADAQTFSAFEMANLNNRQQARLQNAQSFLQMDLANLENEQATTLFKSQAQIQALFTDQAADNAAKQFNATSQNQTDQFFASLKTQVSQFNASQQNAIKQFNADAKNTMEMFNKNMQDQRDQFEATNRLVIDQSNAKWRQTIATQDNANINEANRQNAQSATGLTTAAYNNLWQRERDIMAFAFTASENAAERANQVVLSKMGTKSARDVATGQATGAFVSEVIRGVFDKWL